MPNVSNASLLTGICCLICYGAVHAADVGADPMRPDTLRSKHHEVPAQYRVNAIIVSNERRIAIVNGKRVGVGDSIGDASIVSIDKREVVIEVDRARQFLRVSNGNGQ